MSQEVKIPLQRVKLIRKHSWNCHRVVAVEKGEIRSPWTGLVEKVHWLSSRGDRRGRTTAWLEVRCNNPNCNAAKLVRSDVLAEQEGWQPISTVPRGVEVLLHTPFKAGGCQGRRQIGVILPDNKDHGCTMWHTLPKAPDGID